MRRQILLMALSIFLCTATTAQATLGQLAIAGRSGSLGLGGDLTVGILDDLNARVGIGFFKLDLDGEVSDIDYDFELSLLTYPIMLDWYPFDNDFHISGGIVINETEVDLDARYDGTATVDIGGTTYPAAVVGTLSGNLSFDRVAPYVGIGWGNAFGKSRRWGFMTDLGVAFTNSPKVALSVTGAVAGNDLAAEEDDIQDDLDKFTIYPVFSASLYFRF